MQLERASAGVLQACAAHTPAACSCDARSSKTTIYGLCGDTVPHTSAVPMLAQAAQRDQQRDGRVDRDDRHEQPRRQDAGRSETFEQRRHGGKSDDTSTRYGDCSASNEVSGTYVIDARGWTARVAPFVCVCVGVCVTHRHNARDAQRLVLFFSFA